MRTLGSSVDGDHIETQWQRPPFVVYLKKIASGANDFALLAPSHRLERSTKVVFGALPDFDDEQQLVLTGDDVQFAGAAAQVAGQHLGASALHMADGEGFASQSALHTWGTHDRSMQVAALTRTWRMRSKRTITLNVQTASHGSRLHQ
jgi:hypothetical protein